MTGAFDDRLEELSPPRQKQQQLEQLLHQLPVQPLQNPHTAELQEKLQRLRLRREHLATTRRENAALKARLDDHVHDLTHQQELSVADVMAWKGRRHHASKQLEESYSWNVLNDAFSIVPQGPFATINGVRLGSEAIVSVTTTTQQQHQHQQHPHHHHQQQQQGMASSALGAVAATVTLPGRYLLGFGGSSTASTAATSSTTAASEPATSQNQHTTTATNTETNSNTNQQQHPQQLSKVIRVPWTEINSALGQIALLLSILEQIPSGGIHFPHHSIFPQGSTSKIGLRQPNAITGHSRGHGSKQIPIVAMYHLYSDDSFQLFGKRNFNLALRALTECLAIAAQAICKRDRTIVMPFDIQVEHDNPTAPCTIGGLPVQYINPSNTTANAAAATTDNNAIQWTRVVKYMLINVKWCLAYYVKHVDR